MDDIAKLNLDDKNAEIEIQKTENYIFNFLNFYKKISDIANIEYPFSKEFITKNKPTDSHKFLISVSIQLVLLYDYILENDYIDYLKSDIDYNNLYHVMSSSLKDQDLIILKVNPLHL